MVFNGGDCKNGISFSIRIPPDLPQDDAFRRRRCNNGYFKNGIIFLIFVVSSEFVYLKT